MSETTNKYFSEVRERAVRMVLDNPGQHESRWTEILSISSKIGCAPQTLNDWFNNRRLLEPIGNIPPAEAETNFYAALETSDMAG